MSRTREKKSYAEMDESGSFWISTLLDTDSRLRVVRGIGKNETEASLQVFQTIQRHSHDDSPLPLLSDSWGVIDEAMLTVYGAVPEYGGRGRPSTRPKLGKDWLYLQMIKKRDEYGHL